MFELFKGIITGWIKIYDAELEQNECKVEIENIKNQRATRLKDKEKKKFFFGNSQKYFYEGSKLLMHLKISNLNILVVVMRIKVTFMIQQIKDYQKEIKQTGQGLKILTPNQILSRLPIILAQSQAGNN